jgi:peptidoglycan/LPS O-acetylase OafA/YrhL
MRPRIQALDGLRFLAALGVLWIHAWTRFGNPRLITGRLDLTSFLAIGGNGVDLFFVISGFCMYYFYAGHREFSYRDFGRFLFKRWSRLSPAFYTITIIYLLFKPFPVWLFSIGTSAAYLNSIFTQFNAGGHFWTLGTEWQFYLLIPFILIYQRKIGFKKIFVIMFGVLGLLAVLSCFLFDDQITDMLTVQILFRGVEFGFGIIAARLLLSNYVLVKNRRNAFALSMLVTYAGRFLTSAPGMSLAPQYHQLIKLSGFSLMGAGFAGILYLAVTSQGPLGKLLSNRVFRTLGKISYSFYLWHGLILGLCSIYIAKSPLNGAMLPMVSTIVVTIILFPVSYISYQLLEKPFLSIGNLTTK